MSIEQQSLLALRASNVIWKIQLPHEQEMTSLATAGIRGALAALAAQGTSLFARLATVIVLARLLVPEHFGLVAIVAAFAEFAAGVVEFGLPLAAAQAGYITQRVKSTLFLANTLLGLTFAGVFWVCSDLIATLYADDRLTEIVRWLALIPLAVGLSAQFRAQLMTGLQFISLEVINTVTRLAGMSAAVVIAATTASLYALVALAVLPPVLQLPCYVVWSKWWPRRPGAWVDSRQLIAIGARIFGLNILRNLSRTAIVPVLGLSETATNVGFYDRAYQLSATPANALMDSLQRIAVPILSRVRSDRLQLQRAIERVQATTTMVLVTGVWVLAALGEPAVVLALGKDWHFTGQILQILAIGAGFRLMGMMQQWLFIAGQATRAGLIFSACAQPVVILVSLAGLPWGVIGVAGTSAIAWAAFWPLSTVAAAKATGLSAKRVLTESTKIAITFSAPVALSALISRLFIVNPMWSIVVGFSVAAVVGGTLILCRSTLREKVKDVVVAALGRQQATND
ncbi:oligosaccharide flippase family protein [Mycolicibacterium elephantis]